DCVVVEEYEQLTLCDCGSIVARHAKPAIPLVAHNADAVALSSQNSGSIVGRGVIGNDDLEAHVRRRLVVDLFDTLLGKRGLVVNGDDDTATRDRFRQGRRIVLATCRRHEARIVTELACPRFPGPIQKSVTVYALDVWERYRNVRPR